MKLWMFTLSMMLAIPSLYAQDDTKRLEELEKKIEVLSDEVQNAKSGYNLIPSVGEGKYGLAPAASKVYHVEKGVSLGGYGEMIYQNQSKKDQSGAASANEDTLDFVRQILYLGYRFSDKFLLNSEIEFEHGSTEEGGSVSVEFAYLDYLFKDLLSFRAGMVLIPMGLINEMHEPTTFLSSYRPRTEKTILPSTWRENGVGIFGSNDVFSYKLYVVNSFDALGFTSDEAFYEGRQSGAEAKAHDFAATGRLDYYGVKGLLTGVSFFSGQTGQHQANVVGNSISAWAHILDAHVDYRIAGLQLRTLLAYAHLQDAGEVNTTLGLASADGIGSDMIGFYAEAGYDVLHKHSTEQKVMPFVRYEKLNTQYKVPNGYTSDPANDQEIYTLGVHYSPIMNIALKFDYELHKNAASSGVNQWNLAMGYIF